MDEPTNSNAVVAGNAPPRNAPQSKRLMLGLGIALCGALAVGIPSVMWLGAKAASIEHELKAAEDTLPALQDQVVRRDPRAASKTVSVLKSHTNAAYRAATDGLWIAAGSLPWVGANFRAATEVATSANDVAELGLDPLVSVSQSINWTALSPSSNGFDLKPLQTAQPKLMAAANAVNQSSDRLDAVEASSLTPQISEPLVRARDKLRLLGKELTAAADAATLAPDMMGATAPRQYLLLIQNNAEARATGGIPGALAVLNVDKGKLTLRGQTTAAQLGTMNPLIPLEPEQQRIYSGRVGKFMQDVNLTPDFPTSASTAQAMWEQKTGDRLDGVISIDPVALSYLLNATGPIGLPTTKFQGAISDPMPPKLTSQNVVKTLLSDVYSKIPDPALQDLYFATVAQELFNKLSTGTSNSEKLVGALSIGVDEGRIMVWSAIEDEQVVIDRYPLSGSISGPNISPAQFGVYFNDGTGAKMDYYVKRTVQLVRECTDDGYVQVKVLVNSTNTASALAATTLPAYVTGGGSFGVPAGTVQTNIVAYGPVQSNVETVFVGGKKAGFASQRHDGRPVGAITLRLDPGQSSTVEFTFGKIVQHTEPRLAVTPTVQPLKDVVLGTTSAKCDPAA